MSAAVCLGRLWCESGEREGRLGHTLDTHSSARHAAGRPGDEEEVLVAVHHRRADRCRVSRCALRGARSAVLLESGRRARRSPGIVRVAKSSRASRARRMTPMLCFGIVCLSKGDEDSSCGPGGTVRPRQRPPARLFAELAPCLIWCCVRPPGRRDQHDRDVIIHHWVHDGTSRSVPSPSPRRLQTVDPAAAGLRFAGDPNQQLQARAVLVRGIV